jgi:hypothetical protein
VVEWSAWTDQTDTLATLAKELYFAADWALPRIVAEEGENLLLQETMTRHATQMAASAVGTGEVLRNRMNVNGLLRH